MAVFCYDSAQMFGEFGRKLTRWQEAGIITADQSARIEEFEREHKSGSFQKKLSRVAIFAILLGILSIIGANWQIIAAEIKLAIHFLINIALAAYIVSLDPATHGKRRDFCVFGLFGLFLTFIALIAQIYQLHGEMYQTLLFWVAICTPFIFYWGRSYIVAWPWLVITYAVGYWAFFEATDAEHWLTTTVLSAIYIPILLLIASKSKWLTEHRPGFSEAFQRLGLIMPAVFATFATLFFYAPQGITSTIDLVIGLILGLVSILIVFRPRSHDDAPSFHLFIYLMVSYVIYTLPFVLPEEVFSRVLSAALFILYWGYMAFLGARLHLVRLMDLGIQLVMLRLFIVFLEVFGGLMLTGIGLILTGIMILMLLKNRARLVAFGQKMVRYEI